MTEPETRAQAEGQNGQTVQVRSAEVPEPKRREGSGAASTRSEEADAEAEGPAGGVAPNYRYWREHGGEWVAEYNNRKKTQVYYHVQEIMLAEYVAAHAPAKVLEFGCGVGRHLRNLSQIPGVDVYGYDQSAAMVGGCAKWADEDWIREHITVGGPTGRLPYEDDEFDLVYSCEVLIHVHPGDLPGILKELLRISRRQVFHLEPAEHIRISDNDHDGCWKHDYVAAYERLGLRCDILPSGYAEHAPYRVWKPGQEPPVAEQWRWSPLTLSLYRRLVSDVSAGIAAIRSERETLQARADELQRAFDEATEGWRASVKHGDALEAQLSQARVRLQELTSALEAAMREAQEARRQADGARAEAAEAVARMAAEQQALSERTEDLTRRLAAERERAQSLHEAYQRLREAIVTQAAHG